MESPWVSLTLAAKATQAGEQTLAQSTAPVHPEASQAEYTRLQRFFVAIWFGDGQGLIRWQIIVQQLRLAGRPVDFDFIDLVGVAEPEV